MEKIQVLTEKLYREGVEKGQAEAARIIADAKQQAQAIIDEAKQQAQEIVAQGKKQSEELDAHTRSELKLYTSQALNALKSEITNVVSDKVVSASVNKLVTDKDFIQKFTVALASKWIENEPITITTADAESLKAYFAKEAKELLDKGVKVEGFKGNAAAKTLFTVSPADGSYRVDFGEEEFEEYFKGFLRPQLVEMLF